jgi:DNA polymerase-1
MRAELVGFSFSWEAGKAYYIPCNRFKLPDDELTFLQDYSWFGKEVSKSLQYILTQLQPLLEDSSLQKITQNGKYDMLVLRNYGIEVGGMVFDTMIAHYLLDPGARGHNLDDLALKYLKIEKIPTSDLIGSGAKQITMDQAPVERVADYACEDADCTYQLASILAPELEREGLDRLFHEVEIPLVEVLLTLERNGVALDQKLLADISADLGGQLLEIQKNIYHLAGAEFNLDSPKQLAHILFEKLNLPVQRKSKTGYSTDEGVLQKLAELDPVPKEILKYRTLAKLKNTYAEALPRLINPYTGRLHTSYNQTVAATGRLSSSDPNLQNIPVRTEMGGRIREAFVPGNAGWKLMSADYSQIELRILAHFTGDAGLLEAFRLGQDIHRQTASLIFNCPPELVTQEMRRAAKEVNFGVIYGMREFGLSERLGIPHKRAKEFIDNYFQSYPAVENFIQTTIEKAHTEGYVNTILGRKRPLPELKSPNHNLRQNAERMAVNTPIQGSAADMIKLAMIKLYGRMKQERVKSLMIMQVHDELVFEVPEEEMDLIKDMVIEEMENALSLSVPIKVDASFGENWLQAH